MSSTLSPADSAFVEYHRTKRQALIDNDDLYTLLLTLGDTCGQPMVVRHPWLTPPFDPGKGCRMELSVSMDEGDTPELWHYAQDGHQLFVLPRYVQEPELVVRAWLFGLHRVDFFPTRAPA